MGEWRETKLSDVCDIIPGYAFKSTEFIKQGVPVIKIKDITPPVVDFTGNECVDASNASNAKLNKYKVGKGDFVVAMTGATIGKVGRVLTEVTAYINQRVAKFDPLATVDREYVYYQLQTYDFQEFITSNVDSNSAQENISGTSIGRFPFLIPELNEQRAIASVLSSLDAKIDLLHQQNKTLEAMAETLFRQWFVEEAEEAWEEVLLGDLIEVRYGKDHKALGEGDVPVYGSGGVMRYADRSLFEGESILIPRKGSLNNVMYVNEAFWTVDTMFFTEMKRPNIAKFIYHFVKQHDLASMNVGSAVPSMTTAVLNNMPLQIPGLDVFTKYETTVGPLYTKHATNIRQIKSLTALRDTLLPKLMSGEVRVEATMEQVGV